jgi:prepilin-type processing-associated H-X9-DG protein
MNRKGLSLVEVLVIIAIIGILAAILLPALAKSRPHRGRGACVNNLKQLGLVLNMYTNENNGKFPPIDNVTNNFMFESDVLYPEYLSDAAILACPSDPEYYPDKNFRLVWDHPDGTPAGQVHPDCITNMSYSYLGWMLMTDKETEAFFEAYDNMSPENYDKDIIVPEGSGNLEGTVIHRIAADVGWFLIEDVNAINADGQDANSVIPIMWDQISTDISEFSHVPAGQNVLYLDGHVDFHRYDMAGQDAQYLDGKVEFQRPRGVVADFPISPVAAAMFGGRAREPIPDCEE